MEGDSAVPPTPPQPVDASSIRPGEAAMSPKAAATLPAGTSRPPAARRQLRARPSDPAPPASPTTKKGKPDASTPLRKGTERELEYIRSKLTPEHIVSCRDGVLKSKEAELKEVIDEHDTAVREKFHLERYISIFEGWNPKVSKRGQELSGQDGQADMYAAGRETGQLAGLSGGKSGLGTGVRVWADMGVVQRFQPQSARPHTFYSSFSTGWVVAAKTGPSDSHDSPTRDGAGRVVLERAEDDTGTHIGIDRCCQCFDYRQGEGEGERTAIGRRCSGEWFGPISRCHGSAACALWQRQERPSSNHRSEGTTGGYEGGRPGSRR